MREFNIEAECIEVKIIESDISLCRINLNGDRAYILLIFFMIKIFFYNNFSCYQQVPDLVSKLSQELTFDGLIIACRFPLPSWKPAATIGDDIDSVWLYRKPHQATPQAKETLDTVTAESSLAR